MSQVQDARLLPRHLFGPRDGGELQILGIGRRFDLLEQLRDGKAHPRDHHRPRLDTAQPVDALLLVKLFQDLVDGKGRGLVDQPGDAHVPGSRYKVLGEDGNLLFVGAELIEVVEVGDILIGVERVAQLIRLAPGDRVGIPKRRGQLVQRDGGRGGGDGFRRGRCGRAARGQSRQADRRPRADHKLAAVQVEPLGRDFGWRNPDHECVPSWPCQTWRDRR